MNEVNNCDNKNWCANLPLPNYSMSEVKPVYQAKMTFESLFCEVSEDDYKRLCGSDTIQTRILYPASVVEALQTELQITRDTNLAVVRRLQAKIDLLERQAKKDARYITNAQQEARDNDDSWYNCGEL